MSFKFVNTLKVWGKNKELKKFKSEVNDGEYGELSLYNFLPIPKRLTNKNSNTEAIEKWCLKNWGTTCDVYDIKFCEKPRELVYYFFSIGYPSTWLKTISKQFPDLKFELWYRDEYLDGDGIAIVVKNGEAKEERVEN